MSQYEMLAPNQLIKLIESKDKALYEKDDALYEKDDALYEKDKILAELMHYGLQQRPGNVDIKGKKVVNLHTNSRYATL